jgi:hypothetical protein
MQQHHHRPPLPPAPPPQQPPPHATTNRAARSAVHHHPVTTAATYGRNKEEGDERGVEGQGRGENLEPDHAKESRRGRLHVGVGEATMETDLREEAALGLRHVAVQSAATAPRPAAAPRHEVRDERRGRSEAARLCW